MSSTRPALGIAGQRADHMLRAALGVAGLNTAPLVATARAALTSRSPRVLGGETVGDRIERVAGTHAVIVNSFVYDVSPSEPTGRGGYRRTADGSMRIRHGRVWVLPEHRPAPLWIDCDAPARHNGTSPNWATFDAYVQAVELICPDGFFTFDTIGDAEATRRDYERICSVFPADALPDGRLWPVYPVTAVWDGAARVDRARLPTGLRRSPLGAYIPLNETQRQYRPEQLESWAAAVVANAQLIAADPHFREMASHHGKVALGGMAIKGNPVPRLARHLLAAVLTEAFPGVQLWLLGNANAYVVNGLGVLGLLDRVWLDGSWALKEAMCGSLAYLRDGLITMWYAGQGRDQRGQLLTDLFFRREWLMAGNLWALLGAYAGAWRWPTVPLPIDSRDEGAVAALQLDLFTAAQMLGLEEAA